MRSISTSSCISTLGSQLVALFGKLQPCWRKCITGSELRRFITSLCFLFLLSASYAWSFLLLPPCYVSPTIMSSRCFTVVFDHGVLSQTRRVTSALLFITYTEEMEDRSTWSFLLLIHASSVPNERNTLKVAPRPLQWPLAPGTRKI